MKAIAVATLMTFALFVLGTVLLRYGRAAHRARTLALAYLACLVALVLAWAASPEDLGFLPESLLIRPPALDLAASAFFFSAAFLGGVLQLYNLADRGLSLRVLIDLMERGAAPAQADELMHGYSAGKGLEWMYRKRLDDLVAAGLVVRGDGRIALTSKGLRMSRLFGWLRAALRVEGAPACRQP